MAVAFLFAYRTHTHSACIYFDDPMSNHCCIYLAKILRQRNNSMISCTARTDGRWPAQQAAHNIVFRRTAANVAHSPCPATIALSTYVLNNAVRRLLRSSCARLRPNINLWPAMAIASCFLLSVAGYKLKESNCIYYVQTPFKWIFATHFASCIRPTCYITACKGPH